MTFMSVEEAVASCDRWQKVLRLQDWDIVLEIVRRHKMASPTCVGQTEMDCYHRAMIKLCDPVDLMSEDWDANKDMELTLVHELVHMHMYDIRIKEERHGETTTEWLAAERAIDMLAGALVKLSREPL